MNAEIQNINFIVIGPIQKFNINFRKLQRRFDVIIFACARVHIIIIVMCVVMAIHNVIIDEIDQNCKMLVITPQDMTESFTPPENVWPW